MARAAQQDWGFSEITRKFEREAKVLRRPKEVSRRWLPLPITGTAHLSVWLTAAALCLIGLVALHIVILQKNLEHNGLIEEKNSLAAENARLSSEVSNLSSPERIEQIATKSLGMVPSGKMQYVYIGPAGSRQSFAELEGTTPGRATPP